MSSLKHKTLSKFTAIVAAVMVMGSCALNKFHKQLKQENHQFVYLDTDLDTSLLFGIWTTDPEGPHADFCLSDQSFYVVDYDGDGAMPYFLKKDKITVGYPDFDYSGKIEHVLEDLLIIQWEGNPTASIYVPFPQDPMTQKLQIDLKTVQVLDSVPSASGIALYEDKILVIGDNSPYLYFLNSDYTLLKKSQIFDTSALVNGEIPKPIKPDFEAVELVDDATLLILGSGSRLPQRGLAVLFDLNSNVPVSCDISAIYSSLMHLDVMDDFELNLEALASTSEHLYLFNRANNVIFRYLKSELLSAIKTGIIPNAPSVFNFKLPTINGIESGFSGATANVHGTKLIFTSSVENTDNAYDDGEVLGSFVGCIDLESQLENLEFSIVEVNYPQKKLKIESVAILAELESQFELILVTDNDGAPSEIIQATLRME